MKASAGLGAWPAPSSALPCLVVILVLVVRISSCTQEICLQHGQGLYCTLYSDTTRRGSRGRPVSRSRVSLSRPARGAACPRPSPDCPCAPWPCAACRDPSLRLTPSLIRAHKATVGTRSIQNSKHNSKTTRSREHTWLFATCKSQTAPLGTFWPKTPSKCGVSGAPFVSSYLRPHTLVNLHWLKASWT